MNQLKCEFVAVDFDGTLCTDAFPEIGEPNRRCIAYVKRLAAAGSKIILHTCRENGTRKLLDEAVAFCNAQKIPLFAVNENTENKHAEQYGTGPGRKVYADLYIDDKALNPSMIDYDDAFERVKRDKMTLPPCGIEADKRWAEMMTIAQESGFIMTAEGGVAILATNAAQIESKGVEEYASIQRMNGHCPQEIGLPGCYDTMTSETYCRDTCELKKRRGQP